MDGTTAGGHRFLGAPWARLLWPALASVVLLVMAAPAAAVAVDAAQPTAAPSEQLIEALGRPSVMRVSLGVFGLVRRGSVRTTTEAGTKTIAHGSAVVAPLLRVRVMPFADDEQGWHRRVALVSELAFTGTRSPTGSKRREPLALASAAISYAAPLGRSPTALELWVEAGYELMHMPPSHGAPAPLRLGAPAVGAGVLLPFAAEVAFAAQLDYMPIVTVLAPEEALTGRARGSYGVRGRAGFAVRFGSFDMEMLGYGQHVAARLSRTPSGLSPQRVALRERLVGAALSVALKL